MPSAKVQRAMLARLRAGLVLAGHDNRTLRTLERRREVRAHPLHDPRTGALLSGRAWEITPAGVAAALRLANPTRRRTAAKAPIQIDLEEAIASTGSGAARGATLSPHPTTPALTTPAGATVAAVGRADARGTKTLAPETPTP